VVVDLTELLARIDAVLAERAADSDVDSIERTLTDGYAQALELEAERWRIERKIGEVARLIGVGDTTQHAAELSELSQRLADSDRELQVLRGRLARLRRHANSARAA
jgi:hypothetical protein